MSEIVQSSAGGGNTNSPPKKQVSPSKYWCFTFNNYTEADLVQLTYTFESKNMKYIIGKEIGDSGTKHLQGYIEATSRIRPLTLFHTKKIHWEKRKGTKNQNLIYCSKDGDYKTNMVIPRQLYKVVQGEVILILPLRNKYLHLNIGVLPLIIILKQI